MTAPTTRALHRSQAARNLLFALHYHRFFGQPVAGFDDRHNFLRAQANDRTVRAYAAEAGRFAFYAGLTTADVAELSPDAVSVERIRDAMEDGWYAMASLLAIETTGVEVVL